MGTKVCKVIYLDRLCTIAQNGWKPACYDRQQDFYEPSQSKIFTRRKVRERFGHFLHSCISSDSLRSLRCCANVKCNQLVISYIQDVRAAKREHAHRIYCWYSSCCTSRQLWVINDTRVALLAHTPAVVPCQPLIRKFLRLIRVTKKYTDKYAKSLFCTCGTEISWLNFIFKPAGLEINWLQVGHGGLRSGTHVFHQTR